MKIKQGVIMSGLQLPMRKALTEANHVYNEHNKEMVITSAIDGEHSAGSYHYYGYAVDLRTRYFTDNEALDVAEKIRQRLGNGYTVLFETNHIHIQYNA